ncbi:hypothetical protein AB1Y20_004168 [Prymnesium parvum]|uniref:Histone-lysine N-methyltransferase, H3 lysine-79 specific n=1 Tax=Prymnesium parvum TaxID=97485 RepID=A0AB34J8M0_PRYPA
MGRTLSSFRLGPACHLPSPPPSSPSLPPPTLTLVTNPALLHAAFDNAGASKRTRRLLRERLWLVEDSPPTAAAAPRLAALLSHAYPPPPLAPPPPHEHTGQRSGHAAEYFSHFAPRGYAIGGAELREAAAASLLGLLQLQAHDTFVDLGAATGRLALAAAWLTAARVVGVELSPSRHRQGEEAVARLRDEAVAARLQLRQGDLLEAVRLSPVHARAAPIVPSQQPVPN